MSLRVNLLKQQEYRYQGPVSLRFAIIVSSSLVGAVLLLMLAMAAQRHFTLKNNLAAAKQEWQAIEKRYGEITAKQKDLNTRQALIGELDQWHRNRPDWRDLLVSLQQVVPSSVQFTRLNIRSDWSFIKPPAPADPGPEGGEPKVVPATPSRNISLAVEGRARGELADETVVQLVRSIKDDVKFSPLFETVKLQRLSRQNSAEGDDRLFEIHGDFFPRKLE